MEAGRPVREALTCAVTAVTSPQGYLQAQSRWHPFEIVFWLSLLLPYVLFPDYLSLASQIAITALFALSLDLILGYAGVVSLGHAAFFGIGAYTAGIFSKYVWGEPVTGLLVAALVAGLAGFATSFIVARFRHLTLIMITLGIGLIAHEFANRAHWLTGGSDSLQGISIGKVLGIFRFDLYGYTAYTYSLILLFVVFLGGAPPGAFAVRPRAARHPRELGAHAGDRRRQPGPHPQGLHDRRRHRRHCRRGADADHADRCARLDQLRALGRRAGDAGARRRRPALWRPDRRGDLHDRARSVLRHRAAILVFWIGLLLVGVVMFLPNGVLGGLSDLYARWRRK